MSRETSRYARDSLTIPHEGHTIDDFEDLSFTAKYKMEREKYDQRIRDEYHSRAFDPKTRTIISQSLSETFNRIKDGVSSDPALEHTGEQYWIIKKDISLEGEVLDISIILNGGECAANAKSIFVFVNGLTFYPELRASGGVMRFRGQNTEGLLRSVDASYFKTIADSLEPTCSILAHS